MQARYVAVGMSGGEGPPRCFWIVGTGRAGLAFGTLLHEATGVHLAFSGRRSAPPEHPLFHAGSSPASYQSRLQVPSPAPAGILLAVPDDALADVAERLASAPVPAKTPVLHLSGSRELDVLEPLVRIGCSVGSLHPLAALADPAEGARRLRGAWYGIQGDGPALALACWIVRVAGGKSVRVPVGNKALYHTAAVFAAGSVVTLLGIAERLMRDAGIDAANARAALGSLAAGAADNVREHGPAVALTGPVARGDAETLRLHLDGLSGDERRLYCLLSREALSLARARELSPERAAAVESLLAEEA